MATIQRLPPELIAHILTFLPDFQHDRSPVTIGPNIPLIPSVCRACATLRREAVPLYAKVTSFVVQSDGGGDRIRAWLDALGPCIAKVKRLQLSAHWKVARPSRGEGHVGFYVRLQYLEGKGREAWSVTTGTYPFANDMRGMRLESVNTLQRIVTERLQRPTPSLSRADVEFIVQAMEVVATHPIEAFDLEQSQASRRARRNIWEDMEGKLRALADGNQAESENLPKSTFFTPY